jgi:hypothetical protein
MNCAKHTDVAAEAYCRTCGTALCASCIRNVQGAVYCETCLADRLRQQAAPRPVPQSYVVGTPDVGSNPGLAAMLGFIPGVGAMYNGQFLKGFVHTLAFVCLVAVTDRTGPILIPLYFAMIFYFVFDAYTTAKARRYGMPLPDPLGFNRMFGGPDPFLDPRVTSAGERIGERLSGVAQNFAPGVQDPGYGQVPPPPYVEPTPGEPVIPRRSPLGAFILIGLGVLFLLNTMDLFHFNWLEHFWPLFLIGLGVWIFIRRTNAGGR